METHSRLRSTQDRSPAPTAGDTISMIPDSSLADMLRQAMYENNPNDPELSEEENLLNIEDDMEVNLHSMSNQVASAIQVPPSGVAGDVATPDLADDQLPPLDTIANAEQGMQDIEYDFESDNKNESSDSDMDSDTESSLKESSSKSIKYIVAAVIVFALIGTAIFIRVLTATSEKPTTGTPVTSQTQVSHTDTNKSQRYSNDTLAATDFNTYQDSMTITKYIEIIDDACLFVFEGYAENARAFVKSYVDLNTYNTYKVGARVPILYERITIGNKDYYMKVRLNL